MAHPLPSPSGNNLPASEPQPQAVSSLAPPDFLDTDAKTLWQRVASDYVAAGLLKGVDAIKFSHYMFAVINANRLAKEIAEEGGMVQQPNKKGFLTTSHHPRVQQYLDFIRLADRLGIQFGDSPAARARIGRLLDDAEDDLDEAIAAKPTK